MEWLREALKASQIVQSRFIGVTHGGVAHADDTVAAALLYRAGAEAIYRLNTAEEILREVGDRDAVVFDIGDSFRDKLPPTVAVLDHHGVKDPSEEPSSIIQVMYAVNAKPSPAVALHVYYIDLFDRFGPVVKQYAGPYGNSLMKGLTSYFSKERGSVKDLKFLELLAEAFYSKVSYTPEELREAFKIAERLSVRELATQFPRTFATVRLMAAAAEDFSVVYSREAVEAGFGVDFACHAVLAVPELERYILSGLEDYLHEAKRAAETVAAGRYSLVAGVVTGIALEEFLPPGAVWNALLDLKAVSGAGFVVVRDRRTPGAYTVWRPDVYKDVIDFRKLQGENVVFKHASGFMAVIKAQNAEEAARYVVAQL